MITLTIPGKPIAKKRPRFARHGKFVTTYSDQKTEEGRFLLEARRQINGSGKMTGALKVNCCFFVERPKSHYGIGKNTKTLKPSAPRFPTTKPDIDNCVKFVLDCLNGEAWKDDSQIVAIQSQKQYGEPRTEIIIKEATIS